METFINRPWLIDERAVPVVQAAQRRLADAPQLAIGKSSRSPRQQQGQVVVMSLGGLLMRHNSRLLDFVGGTSTAQFGRDFDDAVRDPNVVGIAVVIDSPGGTADGTPELADKIFAARGSKPIVALANSMAASAAFWIGTAADQLYVVPSGEVGSIGALSINTEFSKADEKAGVTTTIIRAPAFKAEMNPFEKLTDAAREYEQAAINKLHSQFVQAVSRNRGIGQSVVAQQFGRGRMVDAQAAYAAGMVDGITTTETFFERFLLDVVSGRRTAMPERERQARARHEQQVAKMRHEQRQRELQAKGILPGGPPIIRKLHGMIVRWNTPAPHEGGWEMVADTAFDDVLNSSAEVVFTQGHRHLQPIASRSEFQVELQKTREGLFVSVIVPDTAVGRNLIHEINRHGATGWSHSSRHHDYEYRMVDGKVVKAITKASLYEICVCIAPDRPVYSHGTVLIGAC